MSTHVGRPDAATQTLSKADADTAGSVATTSAATASAAVLTAARRTVGKDETSERASRRPGESWSVSG